MSDSPLAVGSVVTLALLIYGVHIPASVYWTRQFWMNRDHPMIERRRPALMVFLIVNFALFLGIVSPFRIIPLFFHGHCVFHSQYYFLLFKASPRLLFWIFCIRVWLAYYDFQKALDLVQMKWRSEVDTSYQPWTIKYQPYLGNFRFLAVIAIILFILDLLYIGLIVGLTSSDLQSTLDALGFYIPTALWFLPTVYAAFKIQKCRDFFNIRTEIRITVVLFIVLMVFKPILTAMYPNNDFVQTIGAYLVVDMCGLVEIYSALYYCVREAYGSNGTKGGRLRLSSVATHSGNSVNGVNSVPLTNLLKDSVGFQLFADFCVRDFSVENILFITQYIQLKTLLLQNKLVCEASVGWMIAIPKCILDKHAFANANGPFTHDSAVNRFVFLWNHYIHTDAVAQVNICESLRIPVRRAIYRASHDKDTIEVKGLRHQTDASLSVRLSFTAQRLSGVIRMAEVRKFKAMEGNNHSQIADKMGIGNGNKNLQIVVTGTTAAIPTTDTDRKDASEEPLSMRVDLVTAFDGVAHELFRLMAMDGYSRFKKTGEYVKLVSAKKLGTADH